MAAIGSSFITIQLHNKEKNAVCLGISKNLYKVFLVLVLNKKDVNMIVDKKVSGDEQSYKPSIHKAIQFASARVNRVTLSTMTANRPLTRNFQNLGRNHGNYLRTKVKMSIEADVLAKDSVTAESIDDKNDFGVVCMHHVGILCENLERSLDFYQNLLGLKINEARPHDKLPYRGAWLWVGSEMIHLMELPNPDPYTGRPEHGGRDRHTCIAIRDVSKLKAILDKAGIPYTLSRSGRPAIFTRDPDTNALEFTQVDC